MIKVVTMVMGQKISISRTLSWLINIEQHNATPILPGKAHFMITIEEK